MSQVFNRGLSSGSGFCNRTDEREKLKKIIEKQDHAVITSPRRYGKTSLVLNVIEKLKLPFANIDLFMRYRKEDMLEEVFEQVGKLLSQIEKPSEKALAKLNGFLKSISLGLMWGEAGISFSVTARTKTTNLKGLFEDLDTYLAKRKKKAVIFIDEVQTITDSNYADYFEGALRPVAQKTKNMSFIFSGSNRRLLGKIFDDRDRPFYKLCHHIKLEKIKAMHFQTHINKHARKQWQSNITPEALDQVTELTLCHPYYVNILGDKLFDLTNKPDEEAVRQNWQVVCREEQSSAAQNLTLLTAKQKVVLTTIAQLGSVATVGTKAFTQCTDLTPKGAIEITQKLIDYDLLEFDEEERITIVDPVIAYWARR